ncbi:MAG: hypothetical protein GVY22_17005 [Gammaproteobacteria bacterium]|jgi:hypothetical protein|nr:hypothetical protein [Gammaproteobacteria bacterium]
MSKENRRRKMIQLPEAVHSKLADEARRRRESMTAIAARAIQREIGAEVRTNAV